MALGHLSLFSGYGGFDLGLKQAEKYLQQEIRTVGYVEIEPYCQELIRKNIHAGKLDWAPIIKDIRSADFRPMAGVVGVLSAGFPCPPFSFAGVRKIAKGEQDNRNLWPETLRVIREVSSRWVVLENVPGIASGSKQHGTDPYATTVISDLYEAGYDSIRWHIVGADDIRPVPAPHRRKRWLCIAERRELGNTKSKRTGRVSGQSKQIGSHGSDVLSGVTSGIHSDQMANPSYERLEGISWNNGDEERTLCSSVEHDRDGVRSRAGRSIDQLANSKSTDDSSCSSQSKSSSIQAGIKPRRSGSPSAELANSIDSGPLPSPRLSGKPRREGKAQAQERENNPLIGSGRQEHTSNAELADPNRGRFEQRKPESEPQTRVSQQGERHDGILANSDNSRSGEDRQSPKLWAEGIEQPPSDSRRTNQGKDGEVKTGRSDFNATSELANRTEQGLEGVIPRVDYPQGRQEPYGQSGLPDRTIPVWPPRPNDTETWDRITRQFPYLAPAITKEAESEFRGVAHAIGDRVVRFGFNYRVNRLKALGNGIVPGTITEFLRRVTE